MNRYDNLQWGQLSLPTLQEQLLVPMAQRTKHDKLLADQEAIRAGLAKVDPLDVHFDKAMELKRGIESQMDATATRLAKEGINPDATAETIRLNRQYNDLVAPTGDIGRINTAKQIYQKEKEDYVKDAINQGIGKEQAERNWLGLHASKDKYTGFDEKGNIINIGSFGAPIKQDLNQDVKDAHNVLGNYKETLANSGYRLFPDPNTGLLMFADRSGNITTSTNIPQVNDAMNVINQKWLNPQGEGYKWAQHAGMDQKNLAERINSSFKSMMSRGVEDTRKENFNIGPDYLNKPTEVETTDMELIPSGIETTESQDVANRVNNIGKFGTSSVVQGLTGRHDDNAIPNKGNWRNPNLVNKPEDVLNESEVKQYNTLKNNFSKRVKNWNSLSEQAQNEMIGKEMQKVSVTFSPITIKPGGKNMGVLIPKSSNIKDINNAGANMMNDVIAGGRIIYDAKTGEKIEKDDLTNKSSLQLYGVMSPHNLGTQKMEGASAIQKISPIQAVYTDDEGNQRMVYVTRPETEYNTPEHKKLEVMHKVFNSVINNVGTSMKIKGGNFKGSIIKYDNNDTSGAPIIITKPGQSPKRYTVNQWYNESLQ